MFYKKFFKGRVEKAVKREIQSPKGLLEKNY